MKPFHALYIAMLAISLAGCAGSVAEPTAVQALTTDQKAALRLSDVTADADKGVPVSDGDMGLICQKVRAEIEAQSPGIFADRAHAGSAMRLNIHFTKFDRGNAFARFMLIGLGQIRIEANVDVIDTSGHTVAQYQVAKDFALGGIAGGVTSVEDVEEGFAKSVAEVVKAKA